MSRSLCALVTGVGLDVRARHSVIYVLIVGTLILSMRALFLISGLALGLPITPLWAQEVSVDPADTAPADTLAGLGAQSGVQPGVETFMAEDGAQRIVFTREFFGGFNVLTALDIIDRIPGANISGTGGARGLGAQGNVLVNGERISGKANDATDSLSRIAAKSVARIELIRGILPGIDVRGGGLLINVVLSDDRKRVSGTYELRARFPATGDVRLGGEATLNIDREKFDALLGAEVVPFERPGDGPELLLDAGGDLLETRDEITERDQLRSALTGNFSFRIDEYKSFKINTNLQFLRRDDFEISDRFDPAGAPVEVFNFMRDEETWSGELGFDWEQQLSDTLSWQSILVQSLRFSEILELEATDVAGGLLTQSSAFEDATAGETVFRNTLDWRVAKPHTLRFGLEAAFNFLDTTIDIATDEGLGAGFEALEIDNTDTKVTEWRSDVFVTHTWQIDPSATLDTLLTLETSHIVQSGPTGLSRTFVFLKPEVTFTKNFTSKDQLRLQVRRRVGQLNFDDFVSNVDLRDETVATGNPDLSPPQRTRFQITYERRWPNNAGRIRIRPFFIFLDDVVDLIPVGDTDDAPGNIGSGERYGFEIEADMRLDWLGFKGGFLSGEFELGDSEVTDPLTGEEREISGFSNVRYRIEYRQDLKTLGLAYGLRVTNTSDRTDFEVNEEDRTFQTPLARLFVEWATPLGLTLEAGIQNVFNQTLSRDRTLFATNRLVGDVSEIEFRERQRGLRIFLNLRGTF